MNCDACRYESPPGAHFCEFCGKDLAAGPAILRPIAMVRSEAKHLARVSPTELQIGPEQREPVARAPLRAVLIEHRGNFDDERTHAIRDGRSTLGRAETCEIRLDREQVDPVHAFLFANRERTNWLDVSLPGSELNGRRVHGEQVALEHGARLRVGETRLLYLHVPDGVFDDGVFEDRE